MRALALLFTLLAATAHAQLGGLPPPDPAEVLAQAKAASGGAAWDALRSQHSKVNIHSGGLAGQAERWSEFASGRSLLAYTIGPVTGVAGFDGKIAWSQDAAGRSQVETAETARELAVNAAYRDRLAFWYPERASARITYKERAEADGAFFDVIRIVPEGGRPFELWINTETKLIERLVEREAQATRTEVYMDLRQVDGVLIPFRVRASRGDGRYDEVVVVDQMEFNAPAADVRFAQPPPPKPDYAFPAGRALVEVPFEYVQGHVFVKVAIDGKAPVRMLLDSRGNNVLSPKAAAALGLAPASNSAEVSLTRAERLDVGGLVLERPAFATVDLDDLTRRVEGMDDIAGVLGYDIFRRLPLKLDYEHARLTLYDPAKFKYAGSGTRIPLAFRGQAPQLHASLDGVPGIFDVDTGNRGSVTLTRAFVEANDLAASYGATREAVVGAGIAGPIRARLARGKMLDIGGVSIAEPVIALSIDDAPAEPDLAGSIGNGVLRRFNVTFDFAGSALYLEKNAAFAQRDVFDRAGMWIERARNGFEVVDVVADGPAAAAGVKAGDVIVAIDGKPWNAVTLAAVRGQLRGEPGRKVRLTLAGGASRVLTLRDLV